MRMTNKDDIINKLQDEVIWLQETELTDKEMEDYKYTLRGDMSETRIFSEVL